MPRQFFTARRTAHLPPTNESSRKEVDTPYYAFVPEKIHPSTPRFADGSASGQPYQLQSQRAIAGRRPSPCRLQGNMSKITLQGILSSENNSRIGLPVSRADPVRTRPRTRMRSSGLRP